MLAPFKPNPSNLAASQLSRVCSQSVACKFLDQASVTYRRRREWIAPWQRLLFDRRANDPKRLETVRKMNQGQAVTMQTCCFFAFAVFSAAFCCDWIFC